jgi:hypothetical protein
MSPAHACDQIFSFVETLTNPYLNNRSDAQRADWNNEFGAG